MLGPAYGVGSPWPPACPRGTVGHRAHALSELGFDFCNPVGFATSALGCVAAAITEVIAIPPTNPVKNPLCPARTLFTLAVGAFRSDGVSNMEIY
jgi:hypothetical protein